MKTRRSPHTRLRLTFASALGLAGLTPTFADLTLHYNFEDLTTVGDGEGSEVVNLASTGTAGKIMNPEKLALNLGPIVVNVGGTQYSLGKVLEFNNQDNETTSAGHIDTFFSPEELGMTNGATWNRDYTAMAWVNFRSTTGDNMVFGQTSPENSLHLGSRNGFFHSGHWGDDIGPDQSVNISTPTNSWHHVAWVNEGQSQSIFLDGQLVVGPGATGANSANTGDVVVIGTFVNNGSFVGAVDEVKIFGDQALTAAEIQAEMIGGLPVYSLAALNASELTHQGYRFQLNDTATSQVNTATVNLEIDGSSVTPTVVKNGSTTTISYVPPTPPLSGSLHNYNLSAKDQANNTVGGTGSVRAPYFPHYLPGPTGTVGRWGVREYRPGGAFAASSLEAVMIALSELPETDDDPEDPMIVEESSVPVINHSDPEAPGGRGSFNNDLPVIGDQEGAEDNFAVIAKTQITITDAAQDYTFSVHSDDGFGLRITGGPPGNTSHFVASYGNGAVDISDPQALLHVLPTGDSNTRGVYHFSEPGTYDVTFVAYEIGGGAFWEVAWAPGHHRWERSTTWSLLGTPSDPAVTAVPFQPRWLTELPGPLGGNGTWGIRTYLSADSVDNLTQVLDFLRDTARTPEDGDELTIDSQRNILNATDPNAAGVVGDIPNDEPFPGNTSSDDDRVVTVAKGRIVIPETGTYTFSVRGDDGFLLRFKGVTGAHPAFKQVTRSNEADANGRFEMSNPNEMFYEAGTGDSDTRGIIDLTAGQYDVEFVHWEGGGGFSYEVAFAKGSFPHGVNPSLWLPVGYAGGGTINSIAVADPGWTVESSVAIVATEENPAPSTWLTAEAEEAIEETLADPSAPAAKISVWEAINFNDPQSGGPGSIPGDVPWPLNTPADDNYFAMRATANFTIATEGDYVFGFQGDDGGYLAITGVGGTPTPSFEEELIEAANAASIVDEAEPGSGALNRLNTNVATGNSRTVGRVHLVPGTYQIKALMFEIGGGAFWEVFGGDRVVTYVSYPLIAKGPSQAVSLPAGIALVDPLASPTPDLVITNYTFDASTGAFSVTIASEAGATYALEYTTGMQPASNPPAPAKWNVAPGALGNVASGGASTTITGNISALLTTGGGQLPNGAVCFFRVRQL